MVLWIFIRKGIGMFVCGARMGKTPDQIRASRGSAKCGGMCPAFTQGDAITDSRFALGYHRSPLQGFSQSLADSAGVENKDGCTGVQPYHVYIIPYGKITKLESFELCVSTRFYTVFVYNILDKSECYLSTILALRKPPQLFSALLGHQYYAWPLISSPYLGKIYITNTTDRRPMNLQT